MQKTQFCRKIHTQKLSLNNFCLSKVGSIINHFQNKLLIELFVCRCKKVLRNFLNLRMVVIARFVDKKCSVFIISLDCRCLLYLQPFCFLLFHKFFMVFLVHAENLAIWIKKIGPQKPRKRVLTTTKLGYRPSKIKSKSVQIASKLI